MDALDRLTGIGPACGSGGGRLMDAPDRLTGIGLDLRQRQGTRDGRPAFLRAGRNSGSGRGRVMDALLVQRRTDLRAAAGDA